MKVLRLENIDAYYGQSQALDDVSININEGEFVTIIGANGAGKTTIMKCIMGLHRPKNGRIYYRERDITELKAWDRAALGIGYIPEGRRVFPDLSVAQNLKMGGYRISDKKRLEVNMERCFNLFPRLKERRNQAARTMSGGEQQMLAIARALMSDPRLLLIDEISMGLMPILVNHSLEIIKKLHQEGITVLLVEQNASKALKVADRGYVLETGRITIHDTAENLRNREEIIQAYLGG